MWCIIKMVYIDIKYNTLSRNNFILNVKFNIHFQSIEHRLYNTFMKYKKLYIFFIMYLESFYYNINKKSKKKFINI